MPSLSWPFMTPLASTFLIMWLSCLPRAPVGDVEGHNAGFHNSYLVAYRSCKNVEIEVLKVKRLELEAQYLASSDPVGLAAHRNRPASNPDEKAGSAWTAAQNPIY
ncbi:hypothetical protein NDU88_003537 [Pleurodeles waltl]|uniref:Uncharacterized protein n=1 Tax=Pleurodeles waltl TaxID=8319 RepID=A0AAV7WSQ2_PLEWA|nr:hypothetical protein NDU88_003537 [Pleurodeles waltl]